MQEARRRAITCGWTASTCSGSAPACRSRWNGSDSIMPFVDGKFVTLRLPYPSGLFPKNVDGRIDDPANGWKGRGLWTTSGTRVNFHLEGGKENLPKAIKIQLRPDPLAH